MELLPRFGKGSNFLEVIQFYIIGILSIGLNDLILDRLSLRDHIGQGKLVYISFFVQYGILVLPSLLGFTLLEDKLIHIIVVLSISAFIIRYTITLNYSSEALRKIPGVDYYTNFRAMLQLLTAIAILGVDFPVFPRRFAKTDTYGISIMDTGTSMFIFAMGYAHSVFMQQKSDEVRMKKVMEQVMITGLLGGIKPVLVNLTGHHHEVTEYGLHWNFFLTLATVLIFSLLPGFCRIMMAISFNIYLSSSKMFENVLEEKERNWDDLLEANKEGLLSLPGYFLIYELAFRFGEELMKKSGQVI
ncbi:hypothetical protein FO519_005534 [Halicephalobus sp. NKZ332]|nr:hypothetical protein FO519_005534 [Halicephalobus sp. NKZ332]